VCQVRKMGGNSPAEVAANSFFPYCHSDRLFPDQSTELRQLGRRSSVVIASSSTVPPLNSEHLCVIFSNPDHSEAEDIYLVTFLSLYSISFYQTCYYPCRFFQHIDFSISFDEFSILYSVAALNLKKRFMHSASSNGRVPETTVGEGLYQLRILSSET
jgi:hypothetical protein